MGSYGYVLDNGRKIVCRNGVDLLIDGNRTCPITLDEKWFVFRLYFEEHGEMPEFFLEEGEAGLSKDARRSTSGERDYPSGHP